MKINSPDPQRCGIVVLNEPGNLLDRLAVRMRAGGFEVDFLCPPLDPAIEPYRFLILRAKGQDITSWAKLQQQRGSLVVPEPRMIELIKDRWTCRQLLTHGGLRLPESRIGTPAELYIAGVEDLLPVVLKQRRVHGGLVRLLLDVDELARELQSRPEGEELIAERFVEGVHSTVCFIEDRVFCFLKPPLQPGITEPDQPSPQMLHCVDLYRRVSDLHFGKIDVVTTSTSEVFVVDSGVSPNLWPVIEADELLHDCFLLLLNSDRGAANRAKPQDVAMVSAKADLENKDNQVGCAVS